MMITIPRLKNNGIVAFLMVLIITIGYLSYQNASDYAELKNVFELEKKELESELNIVIKDYEDVSFDKNEVSLKLREELHKIIKLRDTIQNLKAIDYGLIRFYRKRIANLATQNKILFTQIDSLNLLNNELETKNDSVKEALIEKENLNTKLKHKNYFLGQEKKVLKEKIAVAEIIEISSVKVEAMKKRRKDKYTSTSRSSRTDAFKVEFNLLENKIISEGIKPIYIQILDENKKVIAPAKEVRLKNKEKIMSSDILMAEYHNKQIPVISFIYVNRENIHKGSYLVKIFVNGVFAGKSIVKLR
ncbi:hypothetical protein F7018_00100 [Tenacibaculum aiptasiae]|uniref:Chromosome partitioning protein ParA n=1 Tax=Tenacibaculum aiptasiae TaxID=426481 RepID=A0A7J5ARR4_9FLAO|nr:hypothetical protein [Tenacibaculum aiptasiae]KAB1160313.1 hypothetical protein F7018_00100 [Tenacibaculum aiptasiae]